MFDDEYDRPRRGKGTSFVATAMAVCVGAFVAGILLLLTVRFYVYWSLTDSMDRIEDARKVKPVR